MNFGDHWTIKVKVAPQHRFTDAYYWLHETLDQRGVSKQRGHLFTPITARIYGFKDPRLAMEFKLRWG